MRDNRQAMQNTKQQEKKSISLSGLQRLIKDAISSKLEPAYWIVAEISELSTNYSGHCYMELIEKDKQNGNIIAKCKATIWANNFAMLRPYFESATGQRLQAGISVLIKVTVDFHPVYGLSVNIRDIDPVYTLGELQRQRMAILKQLEDDGIIDLNTELALPDVIESLAVISSASAAGYGDFMKQLQANPFGRIIRTELFAAVMQGDAAPESITRQLDLIFDCHEQFDAVVIIRGGGAATDLLCFDNYLLASNIAQFPIPIITGIGHDRDQTIADRVAHTSLKTPTAVAEFVIGINTQFGNLLEELNQQMLKSINRLINSTAKELDQHALLLPMAVKSGVQKQKMRLQLCDQLFDQKIEILIKDNKAHLNHVTERMIYSLAKLGETQNLRLENAEKHILASIFNNADKQLTVLSHLEEKMKSATAKLISSETHRLEMLDQHASQLDPAIQLRRGYSMTFANGKKIRSVNDLRAGDELKSIISDGTIYSIVQISEKNI